MPLQSTDLFAVHRSGTTYQAQASAVKAGILDSHIIQSATPPTTATHPGLTDGTIWVDTSKTPAELNVWDSSANGGAGGWEPAGGGGGSVGAPPATLPGSTVVLETTQLSSNTQKIEFSVNSGAWADTGTATIGQSVAIRWKVTAGASAAHGSTVTETVNFVTGASTKNKVYSLVVDKLPNAINVNPEANAPQGGVKESGDSTAVTGITAPARVWLDATDGTNPEISVAGSAWVAVPATAAGSTVVVSDGQAFKLRHTTQAGTNTVTTTTVNVGWDAASSVQASYVTTNAAVPSLVKGADTTIAGPAETGATLTATAGTATGGTAPITYATRWQVSADGTSGWADIASATGLTYAIQAAQLNKYIRAVTTATDSAAPVAQTLEIPSTASAKVTAPVAVTLGWNADTDAYTRDPAASRIIDVHVRMRRCLVTDAGAVTYLDADDSTKLAGDWLRLVETTELSAPYTGTHGAEVANTALRAAAPAWSAGTYNKGQRVTHSGSVWECIKATTTATPAAGTAAATLDGTAGQVMVEIPRFSVWHETAPAGTYKQHTFHLTRGTKTDGGWSVHPAFTVPGKTGDFIYVGAYQGTGTNGNGSASGVNNTVNFTRAACRTACAGRGAGWHQLGYWDYNALQWLLITEYQDMNSQRVLGNGAMSSRVYVVPTGLSNARGNRSANAHTPAGANSDYLSYRGVENFYGRAWQWTDGINANGLDIYLSNNPAQWADDTQTNYTANGSVPTGSGSYQRDVMSTVALLPSSVDGASDTTFVGDALWTGSSWHVAHVGGSANNGGHVGALCVALYYLSSNVGTFIGGRLVYSA